VGGREPAVAAVEGMLREAAEGDPRQALWLGACARDARGVTPVCGKSSRLSHTL
jgi:hypothetical protein